MATELDHVTGIRVDDERAARDAVGARVDVDADPETVREKAAIDQAECELHRLEDAYDEACQDVADIPKAATPSNDPVAAKLLARRAALEKRVAEASRNVANAQRVARDNRQLRFDLALAARKESQRSGDAFDGTESPRPSKENDSTSSRPLQAAAGHHAVPVEGLHLRNGAVSAGSRKLVSAKKAQRVLGARTAAVSSGETMQNALVVNSGSLDAGPRPAGAPTEALMDYRGGATVLDSSLRVALPRTARGGAKAGVLDDGDESRYLARLRHNQTESKRTREEARSAIAKAARPDRPGEPSVAAAAVSAASDVKLEDDEAVDNAEFVARSASAQLDLAHVELSDEEDDNDQQPVKSEPLSSAEEDDEEDEEDLDDVDLGRGFVVPAKVWVNLLDYQQRGLQWLLGLHTRRAGGVLGDEMGLGKTIQIAALLSALHASGRLNDKPLLILAPLTVLQQWVAELRKWVPALRVVLLHPTGTSNRTRAELLEHLRDTPTVVVTTYTMAVLEVERLGNLQPQYVVLDEGHKISNPEAGITLAVKTFPTPHRLILSGSPIQNTLKELWSLFDFCAPGVLGSLSSFVAEFEDPVKASRNPSATPFEIQTAIECARVLRKHIAPFMLRRLKRDVNTMLPTKHEKVIRCSLTDAQLQQYLNVLASNDVQDFKRRVHRLRDTVGQVDRNGRMRDGGGLQTGPLSGGGRRMTDGMARQAFKSLGDLRTITNHAALFSVKMDHRAEGGESGYVSFRSNAPVDLDASGKLAALDKLLEYWSSHGHRVLIFSQTRMMLDIIENLVEQRGHRYFRMDGTTAAAQRQPFIDRFNTDRSIFCALLTTRVGGLGVNLVGADRVVIFDPDWNPVTDEQARERAWRIGQTREVVVYRMVTSGTVEEHILHRQLAKLYVAEKVLSDPTLQRSFHIASLVDAFQLGSEYKDRVAVKDRGLLGGDEHFAMAMRAELGSDYNGGAKSSSYRRVKTEDDKKEASAEPKPRPASGQVRLTSTGVYAAEARPRQGTAARLEALEASTDHAIDHAEPLGTPSMPPPQGVDESQALGLRVQTIPVAEPKGSDSQQQQPPEDRSQSQTGMLQTLVHGGEELTNASNVDPLAARLATISAQRTLHRATSGTGMVRRSSSTATARR